MISLMEETARPGETRARQRLFCNCAEAPTSSHASIFLKACICCGKLLFIFSFLTLICLICFYGTEFYGCLHLRCTTVFNQVRAIVIKISFPIEHKLRIHMPDMLPDTKHAVRQDDKPYADFSSRSLELCSEMPLSKHRHSSPK